jgi:hypothetical protein
MAMGLVDLIELFATSGPSLAIPVRQVCCAKYMKGWIPIWPSKRTPLGSIWPENTSQIENIFTTNAELKPTPPNFSLYKSLFVL